MCAVFSLQALQGICLTLFEDTSYPTDLSHLIFCDTNIKKKYPHTQTYVGDTFLDTGILILYHDHKI